MQRIAIACDHTGYELKETIKSFLIEQLKVEVFDFGTDSKVSVDYPIYGKKVAEAVAKQMADKGIIICGTGIGISISANKVKGIRAALCYDVYTAIMSRKHNDANVLAIGARTTLLENALAIVGAWLATDFEYGRHENRVKMIEN